MRLDHRSTNIKPDPCTFAFRGKKRLEKFVLNFTGSPGPSSCTENIPRFSRTQQRESDVFSDPLIDSNPFFIRLSKTCSINMGSTFINGSDVWIFCIICIPMLDASISANSIVSFIMMLGFTSLRLGSLFRTKLRILLITLPALLACLAVLVKISSNSAATSGFPFAVMLLILAPHLRCNC